VTTATGRVKGRSIQLTKPLPRHYNGQFVTVVINEKNSPKKRALPTFDLGAIPDKISRDEIYSL
jgi:hypothetical protein